MELVVQGYPLAWLGGAGEFLNDTDDQSISRGERTTIFCLTDIIPINFYLSSLDIARAMV